MSDVKVWLQLADAEPHGTALAVGRVTTTEIDAIPNALTYREEGHEPAVRVGAPAM